MGYTLRIGEAVLEWEKDRVEIVVKRLQLPDAPAFGEETDRMNERWPSYSVWKESMTDLGLWRLFDRTISHSNPCLLMPAHPGVAPVTQAHVDLIESALNAYRAARPTLHAGFSHEYTSKMELVEIDPLASSSLARGEWLLWWCRWAVNNCKNPVFTNH